MSGYKTIVADPPWSYKSPGQLAASKSGADLGNPGGATSGNASSRNRYGAMSMRDLRSMRVEDLADDQAHLYLWTTNTFMQEAHDLARAWGFEPKTVVTWGKVKNDGSPSMKMGYYFRGATEHFIFATRGPAMKLEGTWPSLILTRRTPHSVKPDEFYEMVEAASPGPRLELFSRRARPGWDVWGNEVDSDIEVSR